MWQEKQATGDKWENGKKTGKKRAYGGTWWAIFMHSKTVGEIAKKEQKITK